MKTAVVFAAILSAVSAAPAIVWRSKVESDSVVHSSSEHQAGDIIHRALDCDSDSLQVVFLLGRNEDGSDSLSSLASEGSLPGISAKYSSAEAVYHHVAGMEGPRVIVDRMSEMNPETPIVQVSLDEFNTKFSAEDEIKEFQVGADGNVSKSSKTKSKRARQIANANVLVVNVASNTDPKKIDSVVVEAIESEKVGNVMLSAVRSHEEVKAERDLMARRRFLAQKAAGHRMLASNSRRLEQNEDGDNNDNNNQDMSGVYYVQMTPNILSGLLFFVMFAFTTWIGISCMGMISGQTVYVDKMPSIGREA